MCVDGVTCDLCAGVVCPRCAVCGVLTATERGELSELSPCPQQPWPITAHPPPLSRDVAVLRSPGCCWPIAVATHNTPI